MEKWDLDMADLGSTLGFNLESSRKGEKIPFQEKDGVIEVQV